MKVRCGKLLGILLSVAVVSTSLTGMAIPIRAAEPGPPPVKLETVWNMEALPDDLGADGWTADAQGEGGIGGGFIEMRGADACGVDGSRALEWVYNPCASGNFWKNEVYVSVLQDESFQSDWTSVGEIWFWIDSGEMGSYSLRLTINGVGLGVDAPYYLWDGAKYAEHKAISWRRLLLDGYTGWVCIPASSFNAKGDGSESAGVNWSEITEIGFYAERNGDISAPVTMFVDNFGIVSPPPSAGMEVVTDMEALPDDLVAAGWTVDANDGHGAGAKNGMIGMYGVDGKGLDGSRALDWTYIKMEDGSSGNTYWANEVQLDLAKIGTVETDWTNAKELWFWMDGSGVEHDLDLQVTLLDTSTNAWEGKRPTAGSSFYIWNETEGTYEERTVTEWQRMPLSGYKGWVCVPLSAYSGLDWSNIVRIGFYMEPWAYKDQMPIHVYFDQLGIVRLSQGIPDGGLLNEGQEVPESLLYTDLSKPRQVVSAFGASGAWWSTGIGMRSDVDKLIELLYTDKGIALNNYRANIGGGRSDGPGWDLWRAPETPLQTDGSINLSADQGAYNILKKVSALGTVDDITIFMNSPPSSMTVSGKTYALGDVKSNLAPDRYTDYAKYVADVVEACINDGIPVKYVSPINEPQWDWIGDGQEGCHYEPEETLDICRLVIAELNSRKLGVKVSLPETAQWANKDYTFDLYTAAVNDPEIRPYIDHFAGHSYGATAGQKQGVHRFIDSLKLDEPLPLHQTEWGPSIGDPSLGIDTAVQLAKVVYEDLTYLEVESWSYWLGVSKYSYSDGLLYVNADNPDYLKISKRFWALGNYSKFVTGHTRLTVDESSLPGGVYASAYLDEETGELVYVVVNEMISDQAFAFSGIPAGAEAEVYETSSRRDVSSMRGTMLAQYGYTLPAQSVTTFVFRNVDTSAIEPPPGGGDDGGEEGDTHFREEWETVFGFEGMEPGKLVRPENHELPDLLLIEDPTHNGGWGSDSNFALNNLYEAEIIPVEGEADSQALKWTCLKSGGTSELNFNLEAAPNTLQDWSGASALEFNIDLSNYGLEDTVFYFRMTEQDNLPDEGKHQEVWTLLGGGSVWISDGFGGWDELPMFGDWFTLPAGFQGKVRIMLDNTSLMPVTWQNPISGKLELTDVTNIWFGLGNPCGAVGKSAYIDDFTIVRNIPTFAVAFDTTGQGTAEYRIGEMNYVPASSTVYFTSTDSVFVRITPNTGSHLEKASVTIGEETTALTVGENHLPPVTTDMSVIIRFAADAVAVTSPTPIPIPTLPEIHTFIDIQTHWAKEAIEYSVGKGLFSGTDENNFSPDQSMTRGMFVTVLGRLWGRDTGNVSPDFSDVSGSSYYASFVAWATKAGIVKGVGGGKFAPDAPITREQMSVILYNYMKYAGINLPQSNAATVFEDAGKISSWAKEAVNAMQQAGIICGRTDNIFSPQDTATRAEVATMLKRFMESIS